MSHKTTTMAKTKSVADLGDKTGESDNESNYKPKVSRPPAVIPKLPAASMAEELAKKSSRLQMLSAIGFNGKIIDALYAHPDQKHLVFPLGCSVVIMEISTKRQEFLPGHTNQVICIAVARSGRWIASGQVNHMGFPAATFLWDYEQRQAYATHSYHKVSVEDVAFSATEKYLASLGGQDDNSLVIYGIEQRQVLCGLEATPRMPGICTRLIGFNTTDNIFMAVGFGKIRMWEYNSQRRTLSYRDCCLGKMRRYVNTIQVDSVDRNVFIGTKSGDIVHVIMSRELAADPEHPEPMVLGHLSRKLSKEDKLTDTVPEYSTGINTIALINEGEQMLIGTGDGWLKHVKVVSVKRNFKARAVDRACGTNRVAKLWEFRLEELCSARVEGGITSVQLSGACGKTSKRFVYIGTDKSNVFRFPLNDLAEGELLFSAHSSCVRQIQFAKGFSEVVASVGKEYVRLWNVNEQDELLRVHVPNMICNALTFTPDGKLMLTAWSDCTVRAFTPESGKCVYEINNAHMKGVTAICIAKDNRYLLTGGGDGLVRVWETKSIDWQGLKMSLTDHKGPVTSIKLNHDDTKCVTASEDGTCIIWAVSWEHEFKRYQIVFANTLFQCALFHPSGAQIVTGGTDRFVAYWEVYNGELLRQLEGSPIGPVRSLDMTPDGDYFASGGDDHFIRVWDYMTGRIIGFGYAHTSRINCVRFTPNCDKIVSVSEDGALVIWEFRQFIQRYESSDVGVKKLALHGTLPAADGSTESESSTKKAARSSRNDVKTVKILTKEDEKIRDLVRNANRATKETKLPCPKVEPPYEWKELEPLEEDVMQVKEITRPDKPKPTHAD